MANTVPMNSTNRIKTLDGLRVALAGFPPDLPVQIEADIPLSARTVKELRSVEALPCSLEISIPYRLTPGAIIAVKQLRQEWDSER